MSILPRDPMKRYYWRMFFWLDLILAGLLALLWLLNRYCGAPA